MTGELKFFNPETGAELHRVPDGATIPKRTPYGYIQNGERWWCPQGPPWDWRQEDNVPRFTREPIAPPAPPLPTEPGFYLDKDGDLWSVGDDRRAMLTDGGRLNECRFRKWSGDDLQLAPFAPVTIIPTETWDRLRVLDPEDTRDRVDAHGRVWRYGEGRNCWEHENGTLLYGLEVVDRHYGPLRFADEVSDDE